MASQWNSWCVSRPEEVNKAEKGRLTLALSTPRSLPDEVADEACLPDVAVEHSATTPSSIFSVRCAPIPKSRIAHSSLVNYSPWTGLKLPSATVPNPVLAVEDRQRAGLDQGRTRCSQCSKGARKEEGIGDNVGEARRMKKVEIEL